MIDGGEALSEIASVERQLKSTFDDANAYDDDDDAKSEVSVHDLSEEKKASFALVHDFATHAQRGDFLSYEDILKLGKEALEIVVRVVHARYVDAVRELHGKYAAKYGQPCDQELEIMSPKDVRDLLRAKSVEMDAIGDGEQAAGLRVDNVSKL